MGRCYGGGGGQLELQMACRVTIVRLAECHLCDTSPANCAWLAETKTRPVPSSRFNVQQTVHVRQLSAKVSRIPFSLLFSVTAILPSLMSLPFVLVLLSFVPLPWLIKDRHRTCVGR